MNGLRQVGGNDLAGNVEFRQPSGDRVAVLIDSMDFDVGVRVSQEHAESPEQLIDVADRFLVDGHNLIPPRQPGLFGGRAGDHAAYNYATAAQAGRLEANPKKTILDRFAL